MEKNVIIWSADVGGNELMTILWNEDFPSSVAIKFGFTDIVCSPLEAMAIRREFGSKLIPFFDGGLYPIALNTPGVRMPGSSNDDQARVMTPHEAIQAGAERVVIGRDITKNEEYAKNIAAIIKNIEGGCVEWFLEWISKLSTQATLRGQCCGILRK